jgi:hypothetical protein
MSSGDGTADVACTATALACSRRFSDRGVKDCWRAAAVAADAGEDDAGDSGEDAGADGGGDNGEEEDGVDDTGNELATGDVTVAAAATVAAAVAPDAADP